MTATLQLAIMQSFAESMNENFYDSTQAGYAEVMAAYVKVDELHAVLTGSRHTPA